MLALFLLAIQCHGLVEDSRFKVTKCSTDDGQPELTFTIDKEYFEQNLSWQADQESLEVPIKSRPRSVGSPNLFSIGPIGFQILKSLYW